MQAILGLVVLIAVIAVPMAALMYGFLAFRWGFRNYPRSAAMMACLLIVLLIVATLNYNRLFPGCVYHRGLAGGYTTCRASQPSLR